MKSFENAQVQMIPTTLAYINSLNFAASGLTFKDLCAFRQPFGDSIRKSCSIKNYDLLNSVLNQTFFKSTFEPDVLFSNFDVYAFRK